MTDQHLSNELIDAWANKYTEQEHTPRWVVRHVAVEAAQWGADQELEACCSEVSFYEGKDLAVKLRQNRRPKPPSLKELALERCDQLEKLDILNEESLGILRSALEELPND